MRAIRRKHPQPVADVLAGPRDAPRRLPGLEHRLPLFYDRLDTVFEFLPDAPLVFDPGVDERRTAWLEQVRDAYEHRRTLQLAGGSHPAAGPRPLEPWHLYLDEKAWERHRRGRPAIALVAAGGLDLGGRPVPRFHEDRNPAKALAGYLRERLSLGDRVVLTTATHGRPQWVRRVERALGISVQPIEA